MLAVAIRCKAPPQRLSVSLKDAAWRTSAAVRRARPHPRILESPGTQANGRVAAPCLGILPGFAADARFGTKANALTCRRMPQRAMRPAPVGRNGVGRIFGGTAPAAETLV